MRIARTIALYILILFTTGYVALGVFFIICPFEHHFDTPTFIKYWKIVDGYMGKRMPIYGMLWLIAFAINIILFARTWKKSPILWIIISSLALLIADMVFTGQAQLPINNYIQTLDMNSLTNEQISKLQGLRDQIDKNFGVRHYFGWTIFFLMSLTPYLLPKLDKKTIAA